MFDFQSSSAASLDDLKNVELNANDWMQVISQLSSGGFDPEDKA